MAAQRTPLLLALCVWLIACSARAELGIDLITIEPGEPLFERFGHSALRVYQGDWDIVYSFGAAPFFDPAFLWKFVRGEGEFLAVAEPYATALARAQRANRTFVRQQLLLSDAQKVELALRLSGAVQAPHNRYVYDQLYDNCATRVRDLINRVSHGALSRAASRHQPKHSYRDDTLAAMAGHPLGHWALDLIGGRHQDLPVTSFHEMYLPMPLCDRVAEARLGAHGEGGALAAKAQVVFRRRGPPLSRSKYAARAVMLGLSLLLAALALGFMPARGKARRFISALAASVLALVSGLFGLLVWPLAIFSHVHNFSPNENALLFWPMDLWLIPVLVRVIAYQRAPGPIFRAYVGLKLLALLVLVVLKLLSVCVQHNAVFVCVAFAFALPLGRSLWPRPGLARSCPSR